jgi:hypothetical protein
LPADLPAVVDAAANRITVLRAGKLLVKTWRADGAISNYDNALHYAVEERIVRNIGELSGLLGALESDRHTCIVRGSHVGYEEARRREPDLKKAGKTFRRKTCFDDRPRHMLCADVDGFEPLSTDLSDPIGALEEFIQTQLPAAFHGISYHYQLSNSFGHPDKPGLRAHVWFWLKKPYTSAQLRDWAQTVDYKGDAALFDTIQCHYTGAPVFEGGVADPVPVRSGFVQGRLGDAVDLQLTADASTPPRRERPSRGEKVQQAIQNDPIAQHLISRGLFKGYGNNDALNIVCPFEHAHTGASSESSTVYFPANTGGYKHGAFKCQHAHCRERAPHEFLAEIGYDSIVDKFEDISGVTENALEQFYAYLPEHKYIYRPTRALWPAQSVDAHLCAKVEGLRPSAWLDKSRAVQQMTWCPGKPELIADEIAAEGGWIAKPGAAVYNLYRAPAILRGDAHAARRWRDHMRAIYPGEADHIERWLAHRVQRPGEKINHALVLGGSQGIGKDSLLEPVKRVVGQWNWSEISPAQMLGQFNGWVKAVVVRVSEARDLGDVDRFKFYDHSKTYIAAPPDTITCNEKYIRAFPVVNVMGVIITTNHRTDGIYLPADDRRHFVAWSDRNKSEFDSSYWADLWAWIETGGAADVGEFLRGVDLRTFDPKAPPPKTDAFYSIVAASNDPADDDLGSVLERMGRPAVVTISELRDAASGLDEFSDLSAIFDPRARRRVPHAMERVGYEQVRNEGAEDGLWKFGGKRQAIYGRRELPRAERIIAARAKTQLTRAQCGSRQSSQCSQ